ncbi:MAG TPA: CsgG/HfaB family protein [Thermoanaerobaculia bacterium]|nr:CsgG/HfaB family protein [Thermoanaerobaculia bacterium]
MKRTLLAAALFSLAGLRADAAEKPRLVLLPFGNLSGVERAQGALVPTLALKLTSKGWDVVRGEAVEEFLQKERIRYVDSVTPELRKKLLSSMGAEALVSGSIYSFAEGDNSVCSLSARMVKADGTTAWSGVTGLTSEETEGLLGLGRAGPLPQLAERSLDTLLRKFPAPGGKAQAEPRGTPLLKTSPPTYKAKALAGTAVRRVCLLPFENFTPVREAPRVLSDVLQHELVASGRFEVVEAAELRAALVAEKIRGLSGLENGKLAALGKRIGTSLFVRGTVYRYGDPAAKNGASTPEIDLELALLDADAGRIVWMGENARKGRDYKGLFQLGALRSVVALADQVLGEVVTAEGKATPKDVPAQIARRRKALEPSETTVRAGRVGGAP